MNKFIKENWFKLGITVILLIAALSAICLIISKNVSKNNFSLQTKCSGLAEKYFVNRGYNSVGDKNMEISSEYKNHFNLKLNKCLILISSYSPNNDFLSIDLNDAVEGNHYAQYIGHNDCGALANLAVSNKCQLDSGNIWLNGDDTKNPADYHFGFQGTNVGPGIGDKNTQKQFIEHIQPFMND